MWIDEPMAELADKVAEQYPDQWPTALEDAQTTGHGIRVLIRDGEPDVVEVDPDLAHGLVEVWHNGEQVPDLPEVDD